MARLDVEKKKKTPWPWIVGFAVFGLLLWGMTGLLTEDEPAEEGVPAAARVDTRPAAVPQPPDEYTAEQLAPPVDDGAGARTLAELAPIEDDDAGATVQAEGRVVATGNDSFWLLAGSDVVRVESTRRVRKGDTVRVTGRLAPAPGDRTADIADSVLAREPGAADWTVVRTLKLVDETG